MNEWIANLEIAAWAPVLAAYFFGVISGWLYWGGRYEDAGYEEGEGVHEIVLEDAEEHDAVIGVQAKVKAVDGDAPSGDDAKSGASEDKEQMTGAQAAAALFPSRSKAPSEAPAKSETPKQNGAAGDPAPPSMKFGALESELRKAKELLAESDDENGEHRARLSELESALKRANGRLKLLMKAVKRARDDR